MKSTYTMEELVPVVAKLAHKYTAGESTSVTYEKAEQLMQAVLYCMDEVSQQENKKDIVPGSMSPQQLYEAGYHLTEQKVKKALDLYHHITKNFLHYDNKCLYDTFLKGFPEFFRWYDIRFEPQNELLTLDYPILKDLSGLRGIDKIYEYLQCIGKEQFFLEKFPESYIREVLEEENSEYKEMIENICEIIWADIFRHFLLAKPLFHYSLTEEDGQKIHELLRPLQFAEVKSKVEEMTVKFLKEYYENDYGLVEYFSSASGNLASHLLSSPF